MKHIDFTTEIPELMELVEVSKRLDQLEALLRVVKETRNNVATTVLEKLSHYEEVNKIWLGDDITMQYQQQHFIIKGLNDKQDDPIKVIPIEHLLVLKDKQTEGTKGEKEQS
jgi:hypothetical protein